jgi:3-oxoacyl-[acyl-carrier protein] reductase
LDLMLENRVALVTAASQGLGYATALQLAREGAKVAICSRDEGRIQAAARGIEAETGRTMLGIAADVSQPDDVGRLIEQVMSAYGGLDILITNTGGPPSAGFDTLDDAAWSKAIDGIIMSAVRLIRASLPHLRKSSAGCILTITSTSVKQPIQNLILSNSLRLAVIGLTKSLALELAGEGIRVNSILPGWTETERVQDLLKSRAERSGRTIEEEIRQQAADTPMGRMATPQEFADVATFLCSPRASYVTGVMLPVDGGTLRGTL